MIERLRGTRAPRGGRLQSLGQDFDRGHREYVSALAPENTLWLRTKPFKAPPNFELLACFRTFAHIVEQLGLGVRAQVLDVGCGPGWLSEFLARCGYWVTGVDISEDMVRIARERVAAISGPVGEGLDALAEFHAMPIRELPWENRFDAAVLYDAMHHFDDEVETLRVLRRALVPGGRIYIREGIRPLPGSPDERALFTEMETYGTLESPFDPEYLRWSVEEAGFVAVQQFVEVDELIPIGNASQPLSLLARWARIRTGRRRPETNTLFALKPLAEAAPDDAWRGRIELVGAPRRTDADTVEFLLRVENTGRAFWPAPTTFPFPQGIVTVAPYVLDDSGRFELPRAPLPRSLPPGDTADVAVAVPQESLRGRDAIFVDLVREGLAWFSPPESPIAVVRLND